MISFSSFGNKFSTPAGITRLMDDLGRAMAGHDRMLMLGGGNPAHIPEIQTLWRERMTAILGDGDAFDRMLTDYETPRGSLPFLDALAGALNRHCGWALSREHITVTSGGQTAVFCLLNMFSGPSDDGRTRKILFPLTPEYVGYADQSIHPDVYRSACPRIELLDDRQFKYHLDFDRITLEEDVGAICLSRPTNPSGNVIPDAELRQLVAMAKARDIPVIVDNAYGNPFPGILFADTLPVWDSNTILTFSLSKLGLAGTRTGIVVGPPELIRAFDSINSVISLANGNVGQAIVTPLLENDDLLRAARTVIRPFYQHRSEQAQAWLKQYFPDDVDYRYHKSEGSLFLWLWLKDMPITAHTLYERLKARGVLVLPGESFFFGTDEPQRHHQECIRINYAHDPDDVHQGIRIIADEVRRAYAG